MAIYHCSIKIISRGKGKSAVAAAAYRAGEFIINEYDGITHDYTRKGGVVHTEILLPEHAPKEYADRSTLWNAVEQIEKNKNSQLAREIELALPVELSREQNISSSASMCSGILLKLVCAPMSAFMISTMGIPTPISCSPCVRLNRAASGVRSPEKNICWINMARESGLIAANSKPVKSI